MHASLAGLLLFAASALGSEGLRLEGTIEYAGPRTGPLILGAWIGRAEGEFARRLTLEGPGPFSAETTWAPLEGPVVFGAFLDANGDGRWGLDEPFGVSPRGSLDGKAGGMQGIGIVLLDPPAVGSATEPSPPREIALDLRKPAAATVAVDGAEAGRGLPVAWIQGKRGRAAAVADLLPMAAGPSTPIRVRVEGKVSLLGPGPEEAGVATFPDLEAARMAALLDGDFRVERRAVGGIALAIAVERGAGIPEDEVLRAAEGAAGFLAEAFGFPASFLPLVVLGGSGEATAGHGAPVARAEGSDPIALWRSVGRALAEAWIRTLVPDAGSDPRLGAAADYLGLLSARASGPSTPEAFLDAFEPGTDATLALLLDATIRDVTDGNGSLARFLVALAPAARRSGGSLSALDWDRTLDASVGFDLSTSWRVLLEKPRGPFSDLLFRRAGFRFQTGKDGKPALRPHGSAGARAAALRAAILAEGGRGLPPKDASSWLPDLAGDFEGSVALRDGEGVLQERKMRRLSLQAGAEGLEGIRVDLARDGSPVPGTLVSLRLRPSGERVVLVERRADGGSEEASGTRAGGILCLETRDGEGGVVRWERWRLCFDELRLERWVQSAGGAAAPTVEEARLRR
ncbi:MAG TPA: hypothetical protein VFI25_01330 [Planctomycetota bacterium]|jgi:hypothetical protein|nr:hypothetical protein [Planctomycetota bacterium]